MGVKVAVMGHTMVEFATSTSVFMTKVCVEIAELGMVTVMFVRGAGLVKNVAVEQGSFIITLKFAVAVFPSTVAVSVSAYVL